MKKTIYIISLAVIFAGIFAISGCQKEEFEINESQKQQQSLDYIDANSEYNKDFDLVARAIDELINEHVDLKKNLKKAALKKFDGDYDILLSDISNVKMHTSKGIYDFGDLLNDKLVKLSGKGSKSDYLQELLEKYPDMQISIPVHAEDWNPDEYTPSVAFVPEEFRDGQTEAVPLYSNGTRSAISAQTAPDKPVIVVGKNERIIKEHYVAPPIDLSSEYVNSAVVLTWTAPNDTVTGYKVYRKIGANSFYLVAVINSRNETVYYDKNIYGYNTYFYYVTAIHDLSESVGSNVTKCTVANVPNAVGDFVAMMSDKNFVKLYWRYQNNKVKKSTKIKLYKRSSGVDDDYVFITEVNIDKREFFYRVDENDRGKRVDFKLEYQMHDEYDATVLYDLIYIPFRDPTQPSPIYLRAISITNIKEIESWVAGAPEFTIKKIGINYGDNKPEERATESTVKFANRESYETDDQFGEVQLLRWYPQDDCNWYDKITFVVVENDKINGSGSGSVTSTVSGGFKTKTPDNSGWYFNADVTMQYTIKFKDFGDDYCGSSWISYYENPQTVLYFSGDGKIKLYLSDNTND